MFRWGVSRLVVVSLFCAACATGWVFEPAPVSASGVPAPDTAAPSNGPTPAAMVQPTLPPITFGGSGVQALSPVRLLDTRSSGVTVDGLFAKGGRVGAGGTVELTVAGRGGVPVSGAGAVVVNVTAVGATASTFVTVFPTGEVRPTASNLNVAVGAVTPNLVVAKVGVGGKITLFNEAGSVNLLVDIAGWFPELIDDDSATFVPYVGTVLAGNGDVVSATWTTPTEGVAVLTASADIPPVDGHLAIFPHPVVPSGMFGRVTSLTPAPGGGTTVSLADAPLGDGFYDLILNISGTEPAALAATGLSIAPDPLSESGCGVGLDLSQADDFGGGLYPYAEVRLRDRYAKLSISAQSTMSASIAVEAAVSCSYSIPLAPIAFSIVVLEPKVTFSVGVSGAISMSASASLTATVGFEYDGGTLTNLTGVDATADSSVEVEASVSFGVALEADIKLLGVAGFTGSIGAALGVSYSTPPKCVKVGLEVSANIGGEIGRWGILEVTVTFGEFTKEFDLYKSPTCEQQWSGVVQLGSNQGNGEVVFEWSMVIGPGDTCSLPLAWLLQCTAAATASVVWDWTIPTYEWCEIGTVISDLTYTADFTTVFPDAVLLIAAGSEDFGSVRIVLPEYPDYTITTSRTGYGSMSSCENPPPLGVLSTSVAPLHDGAVGGIEVELTEEGSTGIVLKILTDYIQTAVWSVTDGS